MENDVEDRVNLSIITATYNRPGGLFHTCREAGRQYLDAQTHGLVIEHLVVADGPDDGARALCERFPWVRYLELPEHFGAVGTACKDAGIEAARGEYCVFWDDDNAWSEHAALHQLANAAGFDIGITGMIHRQLGWKAIPEKWEGKGRPGYGDIDTGCICVRTEVARRVRWQDQHPGDDDWHWLCKLIAGGATVRVNRDVLGWHL